MVQGLIVANVVNVVLIMKIMIKVASKNVVVDQNAGHVREKALSIDFF